MIPYNSDSGYWWWGVGQSISETLREFTQKEKAMDYLKAKGLQEEEADIND